MQVLAYYKSAADSSKGQAAARGVIMLRLISLVSPGEGLAFALRAGGRDFALEAEDEAGLARWLEVLQRVREDCTARRIQAAFRGRRARRLMTAEQREEAAGAGRALGAWGGGGGGGGDGEGVDSSQRPNEDHLTEQPVEQGERRQEGWLWKAGGAEAKKKKQRRYFVLRGQVRRACCCFCAAHTRARPHGTTKEPPGDWSRSNFNFTCDQKYYHDHS